MQYNLCLDIDKHQKIFTARSVVSKYRQKHNKIQDIPQFFQRFIDMY